MDPAPRLSASTPATSRPRYLEYSKLRFHTALPLVDRAAEYGPIGE